MRRLDFGSPSKSLRFAIRRGNRSLMAREWHGAAKWSIQQTSPGSLTWGFCVERVTGIEPAL